MGGGAAHGAGGHSQDGEALRLEPEHHTHSAQPIGKQGGRGERAGGEGPKVFSAVLRREDAALGETKDFLDRVYRGSLSLMVSALTKKQALSRRELDELYELLKGLEEERHD